MLQEKLVNLQATQKPQREDAQSEEGDIQEPTVPQVTKGRKIPSPVVKSVVKRKKKNDQPEAGTKSKGPK